MAIARSNAHGSSPASPLPTRRRGRQAGRHDRETELRTQIADALAAWSSEGLASSERTLLDETRKLLATAKPSDPARTKPTKHRPIDLAPCRRLLGALAVDWL